MGKEVWRMKTKGEAGPEILAFLAGISMFSNLSEASLQALAQGCRFKAIERGQVVFFQSDPSESAFIVRTGEVSIILNSSHGREMVINRMHRGDLFGELGILTQKPRSTSAIAHSKGELLVIPQDVFMGVIKKEPQLALKMLELTAQRLQMSGKRESALAFLDAQARLAGRLLELEKQEQRKGYVTISQEELAQQTGLIRQTVAKALGRWRRAGWLITGRGRILILNREALEELERNLLV
jgi:CRP/FNR family transcriptional regulator